MSATIATLPTDVLERLIDVMVRQTGARPGHVVQLSLVCKEMQAAIGAADLFWERQCQEIGFSTQHGPSHVEPPGWYRYYCMRMKERYTIRCLMRKYIAFLPPISARALARGARPEEISKLEAHMGIALPWQVWELYRYRNGQLFTQGAAFAYDGRLLSLEEVAHRYIGYPGTGPIQNQHILRQWSAHKRANAVPDPYLPLTEEFGGRRQYRFNLAGQIFLQTGLQRVRVADSLAAFLQSLLA